MNTNVIYYIGNAQRGADGKVRFYTHGMESFTDFENCAKRVRLLFSIHSRPHEDDEFVVLEQRHIAHIVRKTQTLHAVYTGQLKDNGFVGYGQTGSVFPQGHDMWDFYEHGTNFKITVPRRRLFFHDDQAQSQHARSQ